MKKTIFIVMISLIFLSLLSACERYPIKNKILWDIEGNNYELQNYPNKYIILNYWANWCISCQEEIPQLNTFYQNYKSKVLIFGVSFDQMEAKQLKEMARKMNIAFPVLTSASAATFEIREIKGLPVTFILNSKGKVVRVLYGKQTAATLKAAVHL